MIRALSPFLLVLVACGDDGAEAPDGGAAEDAAIPPIACRPAEPWAPGRAAFVDRTDDWGLADLQGHFLSTGDIDGDGFADLLVMDGVSNERSLARLFVNRSGADGRVFEDVSTSSGFFASRDGEGGRLVNLAAFADIDGDGDTDAVTGIWRDHTQDDIYRGDVAEVMLNDGTGTFALGPALPYADAETAQTRLASGMVFTDANVDGILDLFWAHWFEQPPFSTPFGQQPLLFQGEGGGTFRDVSSQAGLTLEYGDAAVLAGTATRPLFGATVCDVNGDGRPDFLGAAYAGMWNLLWVSDGPGWTEIGRVSGVGGDGVGEAWNENGNSYGFACGDVDNDGDLDLYSGEIKHPNTPLSDPSELLLNEGGGNEVTFRRPDRDALGLSPPPGPEREEGGQNDGLFDFDNDGRLDVYLGGSPYDLNQQAGWIFQQHDTLQFRWIGSDTGFDHACPHGLAVADFDHDGDLDLVVGTFGCASVWGDATYPIRFYENVSSTNNWLTVRLRGGGRGSANTDGIGARVRVVAGDLVQTVEVHGSWGRGALSREAVAHLGLGGACVADEIEVTWPDASRTTQRFTEVPANRRIEIEQGRPEIRYDP